MTSVVKPDQLTALCLYRYRRSFALYVHYGRLALHTPKDTLHLRTPSPELERLRLLNQRHTANARITWR